MLAPARCGKGALGTPGRLMERNALEPFAAKIRKEFLWQMIQFCSVERF